jgi:hypothetical protein
MFDPFGSMQNMIGKFTQFVGNPMQFMMSNRLNIPQEMMNNPNEAIQYLMNSGKLTQDQYNWAVQQAKQLEHNPQFMNYLNQFNKH